MAVRKLQARVDFFLPFVTDKRTIRAVFAFSAPTNQHPQCPGKVSPMAKRSGCGCLGLLGLLILLGAIGQLLPDKTRQNQKAAIDKSIPTRLDSSNTVARLDSEVVYFAPGSLFYHRENCSRSTSLARPTLLVEAAAHAHACPVCNPPVPQKSPAPVATIEARRQEDADAVAPPPTASYGSGWTPSAPRHTPGSDVHVDGYYRKDGTYVRPHTRSAPRRR